MVRRLTIAAWLACVVAGASVALVAAQAPPDLSPQVDKVFEKWASTATPGCAVGVSVGGKTVVSKAYGMADLEHDVRNTPETIFEAGSVSKQFTAAAVLLLARDGKLSLDDPVRKYIPELPDYGQPLTIRHMLTHTSGLRDWGSVASIGGWPRTSRVYTHAHVLEILSRQRALNFTPGERYSYSNSGYNLAAILIARVSGMAFADFTRQRLFEPYGLTNTSWRDDHGRIVRGRAMSYAPAGSGFRTLMPFENVHGNGGLLTTVGDLLKWNEHLSYPSAADAAMVAEQERPGRFGDGRAHGYALGLTVGERKGVREIAHSGSTAGYQANLARYPEAKLSVAVLCNAANAAAVGSSAAVADLYLGSRVKAAAAKATYALTAADIEGVVGAYRDTQTGRMTTIEGAGGGVRISRGPALVPVAPTRFVTDDGDVFEVNGTGAATATDVYGTVDRFVRVTLATPTAADLGQFVGTYTSDEAEAVLTAAVDGPALVLKRRPDTVVRLTPLYADAFSGSIGMVLFRREGGRVTGLSVVQDRVWDLRFTKRPDAAGTPGSR